MLEAGDAKVVLTDLDAVGLAPETGDLFATQTLPRRGRTQCLDHVQTQTGTRLAAQDTGRAPAQGRVLHRTGLARSSGARATQLAELQLREQVRRDRRLGGFEHLIFELFGLLLILALVLLLIRLFRLGRRRLVRRLLHRRQHGRARGEHQSAGDGQILVGDLGATFKRSGGAGRSGGKDGCAQRRDPQGQRGAAQRLDLRLADLNPGKQCARGEDLVGIVVAGDRLVNPNMCQVLMEGQTVEQRVEQTFVVADTLVQRNHGEPCRRAHRQTVALQHHLARIEGHGETRRGAGTDALGHRQLHDPAVGLDQQTTLGHRSAGAQGRGQVQTAEQTPIGDMQRDTPQRRAGRLQVAHDRQPLIADRTGERAQRDPACPDRIHGHEGRCKHGIPPARNPGLAARTLGLRLRHRRRTAHSPNNSPTARSTRLVEPDSSSGSRRRRCRSAEAAT